jgi:VEFS-Box of polycomb protein
LDEFTDVSESEKQFFKLWNIFVAEQQQQQQQQQGHNNNSNNNIVYICNKTLPRLLHLFVQQHASILHDQQPQLSEEWIKHLANLWDEGQLNRNDMVDVMQYYTDRMITTTTAVTATMTTTTRADAEDADMSTTSSSAGSFLSL